MATGAATADSFGFVQVVAGGNHSMGIKADGTVWAWGDNTWGQLGDGTTTRRTSPVPIPALSGARRIAAGAAHSFAIMADGSVRAWGANSYGQLGDGTVVQRESPVTIHALTGARAIALGAYHSMAILADGSVRTWGRNAEGQLGDGTTTSRSVPAAVPSLAGARQITAGINHSMAILADGTVRTWGWNRFGQLGDGSTTNRSSPVTIAALAGARSLVAGGEHALAVMANGTARAWGRNGYGQLGDGSTTDRTTPVTVAALAGARQIVSDSYYHSMAIMSDGTVRSWGRNNAGQLGDGTTTNRSAPVTIAALAGARQLIGGGIDSNSNYSMALMPNGALLAWGENEGGQLGVGNTTDRSSPTTSLFSIGAGCEFVQVVAGYEHSMGIKADGTVWAWGTNTNGQLGDGTTTARPSPVEIAALAGARQLVLGDMHSMAIMSDGTVRAWGSNSRGQLGDGTTTSRTAPVTIGALAGARQLTLSYAHSMAIMSDGTVRSWGSNDAGQLGDGTTTNRTTPVTIAALANARQLTLGGGNQSMAIMNNGTVRAWGSNSQGQLGDGSTTQRASPVTIAALANARQLAVGGYHAMAILSTGAVRAWGYNSSGQLGDGTTTQRTSPVVIAALADTQQLVLGSYHSSAILSDGSVRAWGSNAAGHLGDGTTIDRTSPTLISGLSGVRQLTFGGRGIMFLGTLMPAHSMAIVSNGSVLAWGNNAASQFGDSSTTSSSTPVPGASGCVVPDTTPPTPNPMSAVAVVDSPSQVTVTADTATDDTGLDAAPYSVDTGTPAWQASRVFVKGGLSPNSPYSWSVRARDAAGNASVGSVVARTWSLPPAALVVSALGWLSGPGYRVHVSWSAPVPGGASSYNVFWSGDGYAMPLLNETGLSRTVSGLDPNTTYGFKVCSVNADGVQETTCTGPLSATTPPAKPTNPTTSSITDTSVLFDWDDSAGATGYEVHVFDDAACLGAVVAVVPVSSSTWSTSAATLDTTYSYYVVALSSSVAGEPTSCRVLDSTSTRTALEISITTGATQSLGAASPGTTLASVAPAIIRVRSRHSTGFTLSARINDDATGIGACGLPPVPSGTPALPATWSGTGLGISVGGASADARWSSGPKYTGLTALDAPINTTTGLDPDSATETTDIALDHQLVIPSAQPVGSYACRTTITATASP